MNHLYVIFIIIIVLSIYLFYYDCIYKKSIIEKFEIDNKWDDYIGRQVLRDMCGLFVDMPKKIYTIPGGIWVNKIQHFKVPHPSNTENLPNRILSAVWMTSPANPDKITNFIQDDCYNFQCKSQNPANPCYGK